MQNGTFAALKTLVVSANSPFSFALWLHENGTERSDLRGYHRCSLSSFNGTAFPLMPHVTHISFEHPLSADSVPFVFKSFKFSFFSWLLLVDHHLPSCFAHCSRARTIQYNTRKPWAVVVRFPRLLRRRRQQQNQAMRQEQRQYLRPRFRNTPKTASRRTKISSNARQKAP